MGNALHSIVDCLMPKQKHSLDQLAQSFHKLHCQTAWKFFPKTDFSNGVCSLSNITASDWSGQVFLLVCLSQFDEGWAILSGALMTKGHTNLSEVLEILEALCCFDAWTCLDKFWHYSNQEELANQATESLAYLLLMVSNCLPWEDGNGWKLPTFFHNLMHIVSDMCKYGKPKESNT